MFADDEAAKFLFEEKPGKVDIVFTLRQYLAEGVNDCQLLPIVMDYVGHDHSPKHKTDAFTLEKQII